MNYAAYEGSVEYNRGVQYLDKKNWKKAIQYFKRAIAIFPCMEAYNNMAVAYRSLGQDTEMWKYYNLALSKNMPSLTGDPDAVLVQVLNNFGLAHYMYGRDTEALECYRRAIRINPKAWDCWWNSSTAWLRLASTSGSSEDFANGWEMYKARFLKANPVVVKNDNAGLMYWDGSTPGSDILILVEQGIGDSLMFARYLDRLPFTNVHVQCDPSLAPLFNAAGYHTVQHASECPATVAYPICSLGEWFSSPSENATWLAGISCDAHDFGPGVHIGIINSGNPTHANDAYRSTTINRFHRLSKYGSLYSLQPGGGSKYVKALNPTSWLSTVSYMRGLDLIIGVDTSGMHLCGSLGLNGWLLQPYKETDFRWGRVDLGGVHGHSIWYPSIDVFNNPQSWETVFDNVETELAAYVNNLKK